MRRIVLIDPSVKQCSKCRETKPVEQFFRNNKSACGFSSQCKQCFKDREELYLSQNKCTKCGKPNQDAGYCLCERCREVRNKRKSKYKAMGRCIYCTKPSDGCLTCVECRTKSSNRLYEIKSAGKCAQCRVDKETGNQHCRECWLKRLAKTHLGSRDMADALDRLWHDQDGLCALSGVLLEQGEASLDHIIPKSLGGLDVIENLRWTHIRVNKARDNMSDEEFVEMCERVVDTFRRTSLIKTGT